MLDHLSIQCADLAASAAFYDTVLAPLGGRRVLDFDDRIGHGTNFPCFWLGPRQTGAGFRESHIAFRAPSQAAVDAFHDVAANLGAEVLHGPRLWPEYHEGYYGAFVRDPDGHNVEAVHHTFASTGPPTLAEPPPERGEVERRDLQETLSKHRGFLRYTVDGLTDEQAARRTTVSELCLGGLIKHVTAVEAQWAAFIVGGADAMAAGAADGGGEAARDWSDRFRMLAGETLAGLIDDYDAATRRTDEILDSLADLDASHPLPEAPWFEPGAHWSARRVLLHLIAETAQHAGHADILRESLDGSKTMG